MQPVDYLYEAEKIADQLLLTGKQRKWFILGAIVISGMFESNTPEKPKEEIK